MPRSDISDRFAAQAARTRQTRKQRSLVRLDQRDSQPDDGLETALPFWKEPAAEIEDTLSLHISIIATNILKSEIGIVMVLPMQMAQ